MMQMSLISISSGRGVVSHDDSRLRRREMGKRKEEENG